MGHARETLARLACDLDEYSFAATCVSDVTFHISELSHRLRNLWSEIHRKKAIGEALRGNCAAALESIARALEYPHNLQLARPYRTFDALNYYVAGRIHELSGDACGATQAFESAVHEDQVDPTLAHPWSVLAILKLGQREPAFERLRRVRSQAHALLAASFQPELNGALQQIVTLGERIEQGWVPTLNELAELA